MSKTRKILGLVMAVALVLNVIAIAAFATDDGDWDYNATSNPTPTPTYTSTWALNSDAIATTPEANANFTVNVHLTTDYLAGPIEFQVAYTDSAFTFVGAALNADYPYANGATVEANAANGVVSVVVIPKLTGLTTLPATTFDDDIVTLTFTMVGAGGTMEVVNSPKSGDNGETGTLVAYRLASGTDICQATTNSAWAWGQYQVVPEAIEIGTQSLPADLALKATAAASIKIDTNKKFGDTSATAGGAVYGFPQLAVNTFKNTTYLNNAFEATNGGSLEYATSATGSYGTGTVITVKDSAGEICKTYTVVIFGDANGDGLINGNDVSILKASLNTQSSTALPAVAAKRMAANCNSVAAVVLNKMINGNDVTDLKTKAWGTTRTLNYATVAANHFANTANYN